MLFGGHDFCFWEWPVPQRRDTVEASQEQNYKGSLVHRLRAKDAEICQAQV